MRFALALLVAAACSSGPPLAKDNVVQLTVTEKGFEPSPVRVKAGQPVKLVVTRKTDQTCATELVIKEQNVRQPLPLNEAVTIAFTPPKSGTVNYACGMEMLTGQLIIE